MGKGRNVRLVYIRFRGEESSQRGEVEQVNSRQPGSCASILARREMGASAGVATRLEGVQACYYAIYAIVPLSGRYRYVRLHTTSH